MIETVKNGEFVLHFDINKTNEDLEKIAKQDTEALFVMGGGILFREIINS